MTYRSDKPKFSLVSNDVIIGENVKFVGFVNLYGCEIGDNSFIGPFVEIQKGVSIGRKVKIQSHTFICSGVHIGDEVFVGHGVIFINDRFPSATNLDGTLKCESEWNLEATYVESNVSIGSNATIMCGIRIGKGARIGAGAIVLADVLPGETVVGNPAKVINKRLT